jgi:membrane protease YdiL (CAAX protease family)
MRRGRDIALGLGYYLLIFPFFLGGSYLTRLFLRRYFTVDPALFLLHAHHLPVWAIVYSLSIWWLIWSPTEETTYQAYVMPRLQSLGGKGIAILLTAFFWTVQHCALPFLPDWRYIGFRFFAFLPGVLVTMAIYYRTRRLMPMFFAHWPMDIAAAVLTAIY